MQPPGSAKHSHRGATERRITGKRHVAQGHCRKYYAMHHPGDLDRTGICRRPTEAASGHMAELALAQPSAAPTCRRDDQ
jgi:hypothetical protein